MSFVNKLSGVICEKRNPLCLGIDPHDDLWPPFFKNLINSDGLINATRSWVHLLLELSRPSVPSVKFQSAMFEAMGYQGVKLLTELISFAKKLGFFVILDAKRSDIGSTMEYYGRYAFETMNADALTVVPYMGTDVLKALETWLRRSFGVYIVWLSSNQSGRQFQQVPLNEKWIYSEYLLDEFEKFSHKEQLNGTWGLVLGANHLNSFSQKKSEILDHRPLLLPGVGAQGATFNEQSLELLQRSDHHLFPMSRGLTGVGSSDFIWRACETMSEYAQNVENKIKFYSDEFVK